MSSLGDGGAGKMLRRDDIGKIAVGKQAIRPFPTG